MHMKLPKEPTAIAATFSASTPESTAIKTTSKTTALTNECRDQKWITLSQLPGFMWNAIRAMGESVFSPITSTRLSEIEVIANLSGHGPHSQQAIDFTANRLRATTDPSNILEYSSDQMKHLFGGATYMAQAVQFEGVEYAYLLVKDPMGSYIYRWPSADTKSCLSRLGPVLDQQALQGK
jgi:hypothetical protein